MLQDLTYELSVLAKAIQHKNLSAASAHVGLSQPQLSRLIAKIEQELQVVLLDRTARRKSGWTPIAQDLSLAFNKGMGRLEAEILAMAQDIEISDLRVGTLEGLSTIAANFAQECFSALGMKTVYLDVLDYDELDSQFLGGTLDLIFTVKPPSKRKFQHILEVGYQQTEKVSSDRNTLVVSGFDFVGRDKKIAANFSHALVSNSLSLRRHWLKEMGGTGTLPVDAKTGRGKGQYTIYLIGSDLISPKLWKKIERIFEGDGP